MTFTRLTLGEPRLRAKLKGGVPAAPCEEPLTYGANILTDPGIETSPTDPKGTGFDFPEFGSGFPEAAYWQDGSWASELADTVYWVAHNIIVNNSTPVHVSTADPRTGSNHLRTTIVGGDSANSYMTPVLLEPCDLVDSSDNPIIVSARVESGDFVEAIQWAKATDLTDTPVADIYMYFLDDTGGFTGDNQSSTVTLTTSYQSVTNTTIVPASSYFVIVQYGWDHTPGTASYSVDQDDFSLEVQP